MSLRIPTEEELAEDLARTDDLSAAGEIPQFATNDLEFSNKEMQFSNKEIMFSQNEYMVLGDQ